MQEPTIIGKPAVLVVDDNGEWVERLDFSLGDQYRVVSASDLADATELAKRHGPEVLLLDWEIAQRDPERARMGVASELKSPLPVILITGIDRPEVERLADHIGGCVAVVERMDTLEELQAEIAKVIACAEE
jgi:CheY-like chemotaxis protein